MPHRGADFQWGGALFIEGHPKKAFWFFHCLDHSISWNRLPYPLHREFDVCRLQIAPALNLGLIPILRIAGEVFLGQFSGGGMLSGELLANEGVLRHYFHFAVSFASWAASASSSAA